MEWLIEASHLYRRFGAKEAVRDVNFQVAAGQIYGLVGPDGAGKTTTLRLLCGAYLPSPSDEHPSAIRICGYDILKKTEDARSQIGYLSQRFSLYEDLTVLENIRFFAELRGLTAHEWQPRCLDILDFVGLTDFNNWRAGQLSGGMKQKLGLASALVTRPRVLLLDEPTTGVDPVTRQDFWQLIIRLVSESQGDRSVCVLISTPYMDEAARCNRISFMRQGRIIIEGSAGQLRASLKQSILELRGEPIPLLRSIASQDPDVDDVRAFGDSLHLRLKENQPQEAIDRLRASISLGGGQFIDAHLIPPTLEDVFIALTENED
jgi:ABC-2 type transport system ATP-binding protein